MPDLACLANMGCFVSTPKLKLSAAENLLSFNRNAKRVSDRENLSPRHPQAREQHFLQLLETKHLTTWNREVVGTIQYHSAADLHGFLRRVYVDESGIRTSRGDSEVSSYLE